MLKYAIAEYLVDRTLGRLSSLSFAPLLIAQARVSA